MAEVEMPKILGEKSKESSIEPNRKKVVAGETKKRKKSILRDISEDGKDIGSYIYKETIEPGVQNLVYGIIDEGLSVVKNIFRTLIYKDESPRSFRDDRRRGSSTIRYENYYAHTSSRTMPQNDHYSRSSKFELLVYETRGDAEDVLASMCDVLETDGKVRISDYYEFSGEDKLISPSDNSYGWHNLDTAKIRPQDGGYVLYLPRPKQL